MKGVAEGKATITVKTQDGNKIATCEVTVQDKEISVGSVSLSDDSGPIPLTPPVTIAVNATKTLTATVLPSNATNKAVTWKSSNDKIAEVDPNGKVTGRGRGTASIIVATKDGGKTATCFVDVEVPVTSISLKAATNISVGGTETLVPTFVPTNATSQGVTWSCDPPTGIVTYTGGVVVGVAEGKATITATAADITNGTKTAKCVVTVGNFEVKSVSLDPSKATIPKGVTPPLTLKATITPDYATDQRVNWSSTNTNVATVLGSGLTATITTGGSGMTAGTATIIAVTQDKGEKATCTVTVTEPVTGVTLDKLTESLLTGSGNEKTLVATVAPSTATDKNVTWSSSNNAVATVTGGVVTGVAAGTAKITVTSESDTTKTASCTVTVTSAPVAVTGVTLNKSATTIAVDVTEDLVATVKPDNATNKNVIWSSSNTSVASVNPTTPTTSGCTVTAVGTGTATITATPQSDTTKTASCAVTVTSTTVPVTGVTLDQPPKTIYVNNTETLTATVKPDNATNKNVIWSSSNPSVASVSPSTPTTIGCTVTGVGIGTATITATSSSDATRKANCTVTVSIMKTNRIELRDGTTSINDKTINMPLSGGAKVFTATVTPTNATYKTVAWVSSVETVATVSGGTVTPVAGGTTKIIAVTDDGVTAECTVTVDVPVTGVSLNKSSTTISVNNTETLTPTVAPNDATNKKVTWFSSNESIATVDNTGKVTGKGGGTATITATTQDGSKTATCAVTVKDEPVTGVELNKTSTTITKDETETLTATVQSAGPAPPTNKNVTWFSSNESIATVDNTGKVTGKGGGTATITVLTQEGGFTKTCIVTVNVPVTGVTLPATASVFVDGTETLIATFQPTNATNKKVFWKSSDNTIAFVDPALALTTSIETPCIVTGKGGGTATITATTVDGGKTATCTVTVNNVPVTGVTWDKTAIDLDSTNTSAPLKATIAPANATNQKVIWTSSNPSVATVSNDGAEMDLKTTVTPATVARVAVGVATITVRTVDGSKTATCTVTVK